MENAGVNAVKATVSEKKPLFSLITCQFLLIGVGLFVVASPMDCRECANAQATKNQIAGIRRIGGRRRHERANGNLFDD